MMITGRLLAATVHVLGWRPGRIEERGKKGTPK